MFPRLVKRSFLLIVQIGVVLVILQHSHSSLLRSCFFFFFLCASCINAALPAVWWKTSSGWFHWLFPPLWLKVPITEISCSGFFFGSGNNKKTCQLTTLLNEIQKKKTDPPEMHQHFLRVVYFLIVSSFFFLINHSWQVSQLTISSESWMPRQTTAVIIVNITTHFHQTNLKNATSLSSLVNISLVLPPSN